MSKNQNCVSIVSEIPVGISSRGSVGAFSDRLFCVMMARVDDNCAVPLWLTTQQTGKVPMPPQALDDLVVLDLTHYIAGPYCTRRLADFGARVIKIERPNGGDPGRRLGPLPGDVPHAEKSGLFLHLNANKESVTLNLKVLRGRQLFFQLLTRADVVVESFHPRVMRQLQLDYPLLRRVKPAIVMTSISNFGQTGPYRDWKAQDLTLYAMGGEMYSSGAAGREPLQQAPGLVLYQGGSVAATATLIGVFGARRHHIGQHIDISLFETQAGSIDRRLTALVAYQYNGASPGPEDPQPVGIMPSGIFPCQDGFVDIRTNIRWWPRLVAMMEMPELNDDPRFGTDEARLNPAHREAFHALFLAWLMRHTRPGYYAPDAGGSPACHGPQYASRGPGRSLFCRPRRLCRCRPSRGRALEAARGAVSSIRDAGASSPSGAAARRAHRAGAAGIHRSIRYRDS
jgi:crotonobetainyl-CoA:carnitine CoA-transferase CaiB-like acyl-CoA transferase